MKKIEKNRNNFMIEKNHDLLKASSAIKNLFKVWILSDYCLINFIEIDIL